MNAVCLNLKMSFQYRTNEMNHSKRMRRLAAKPEKWAKKIDRLGGGTFVLREVCVRFSLFADGWACFPRSLVLIDGFAIMTISLKENFTSRLLLIFDRRSTRCPDPSLYDEKMNMKTQKFRENYESFVPLLMKNYDFFSLSQ